MFTKDSESIWFIFLKIVFKNSFLKTLKMYFLKTLFYSLNLVCGFFFHEKKNRMKHVFAIFSDHFCF